jgi:hypothetical protein
MFELQQVLQDDCDATAQLVSLGSAQALDLLGKVLPIER